MPKSAKKQRSVDAAFYDKCRCHARRQGYAPEICDDFPSWAFVRKAEGASGTIAQLFVDYLRVTFGTKNSPHRDLRTAVRCASSNSGLLDLQVNDPFRGYEELHTSVDLWRRQTEGKERAMVGLFYWYGFSREEIAELFGVSGTRVGQILRRATTKMAQMR